MWESCTSSTTPPRHRTLALAQTRWAPEAEAWASKLNASMRRPMLCKHSKAVKVAAGLSLFLSPVFQGVLGKACSSTCKLGLRTDCSTGSYTKQCADANAGRCQTRSSHCRLSGLLKQPIKLPACVLKPMPELALD